MHGRFRRDLTLSRGLDFRLHRRRSARIFSALLALAALGWGLFDLWFGYPWPVGIATLLLGVAFFGELIQGELSDWRFEGDAAIARHLTLRGVRIERVPMTEIEGVHVAFADGRARAWLQTREGEQYALIEGEEAEVRAIADRLALSVQLANMHVPREQLN